MRKTEKYVVTVGITFDAHKMVTGQELSAIVRWTIITSVMSIVWNIVASIGRRKKEGRKEQRNEL